MGQHNDIENNPLQSPMWRLLSEISIPRGTGDTGHQIEQDLDKFLLVLKEWELPLEIHMRIQGSLTDAGGKAKISKDHGGKDLPLLIQLFIEENDRESNDPKDDQKTDENNQVQNGSFSDPEELIHGNQDPKRPIHQGWGYFVVEKAVEHPRPSTATPHYLIRVFLYKEGNED